MNKSDNLGIWRLTAIVFGSVIGGSIFNIAQNMAHGAALGAVLCAWCLTGMGIFFLVKTFQRLSSIHPEMRAGIYEYAQAGFGRYVGFNMAWGYWLCVILGNTTYAVMLNDTFGAFFPVLLHHGWPTLLLGSGIIWAMYYIVTRGVSQASYINTVMSVLKFGCILLILAVLSIYARVGMFSTDFWGNMTPALSGFGSQVSSCMLVTIWSFLGIEGAVMMSARAKRQSDVRKATMWGFLLALILYILVTALCFGVMTQPQLAGLPNPSLAYVLDSCAGPWAKWFVIVSIIISVAGGFIAWTLLCAQTPYEAAEVKIFPSKFLRLNSHGVPAYGMAVASIAETLCLLLVITAENVYLAAVNLASMMILPCYFFCGLYLMKISFTDARSIHYKRSSLSVIALLTMIYCAYSMWAGSLWLLMLTSIFYLSGTPFMLMARRSSVSKGCDFWKLTSQREKICILILMITASVSIWLLSTGRLALDS